MASQDGLKVRLQAIKGVTPKNLLKTPYYFQCPPTDTISYSYGHNSQVYTTIPTTMSGGDYKRIGGKKLRTIAFSTLIVDTAQSFVLASHLDANVSAEQDDITSLLHGMIKLAEGYKSEPPVFHLLISHDWRSHVEIAMQATLPDLSIEERGGETDARYLSVTFEQWREPFTTDQSLKRRRAGGKDFPITIMLKAGDTLYSLAHHYYGKKGAGRPGAQAIAKQNAITDWGFATPLVNMKRYKVGSKLVIPEVEQVSGSVSGVAFAGSL